MGRVMVNFSSIASLTALHVGACVVDADKAAASWTMPARAVVAVSTDSRPSAVIDRPLPICTRPVFFEVAMPGLAVVISEVIAA